MPRASAPDTLRSWLSRPLSWALRPRPVRTLLLLMSLALLVPAMLFSGYLVARSAAQQRLQVEQRLVQVASDLADDVDREIERTLTLLDTLALSHWLAQRDFAAFHAQATAAVRRLGTYVIVLDPSLRQLINTRVPYGTPLPIFSDPESPRLVQATNAPVVSNLIFGAVSKKHIFDVLTPLSGDGLSGYVLIMTVDAEHLLKIMQGQKLPPAWVTGITDRHGKVVARSRDHAAFVGKVLPARLFEAGRTHTGAYAAVNLEGTPTLRAVAHSKRSGWWMSANVPLSMVNAEIRRSQLALAMGGLVLLVLAVALASLFARLIIAPMQALVASAGTLEADTIPPPLTSPVAEANEVATALRSASIELHSRTQRLADSERRLNLAQSTARLAYVDLDLAKRTVTVSDTFAEIFGFDPPLDDMLKATQALLPRIHPDDRPRVSAAQSQSMTTLGTFEVEYRIVLPDGEIRWISARGETIGDTAGQPVRILGTNLDITARKEQEEHIQFLLREVSHRSKNLLAVIQAMATQTARSSPSYAEFQSRFSQRLQGMAASHDLLVNQNWDGVDLATLVRAQLRPFAEEQGGRLEISGANFLLKPEAAQSIGLALHELATNAMKHGALSAARGKVQVSWEAPRGAVPPLFTLTWRESGGPTVAAPDKKGFGHIVFDRMIAQALNASIDLQYRPDGIAWSLATTLEAVAGFAKTQSPAGRSVRVKAPAAGQ